MQTITSIAFDIKLTKNLIIYIYIVIVQTIFFNTYNIVLFFVIATFIQCFDINIKYFV